MSKIYFVSDMLDSMDSLVDRNESPSEPFPGYVPQSAPTKTAQPINGKIAKRPILCTYDICKIFAIRLCSI